MIGLSGFLNADFTKVGNVVTDSKTGLVWQDDAVGSQMNWQEGIDYCEALSLDSHDDWRLPNINEFKTLIDRSKREPAIKENVFEYIGTNNYYSYWSSTSIVGYEDVAWFVFFYFGDVNGRHKNDNFYVRCVRDGQ